MTETKTARPASPIGSNRWFLCRRLREPRDRSISTLLRRLRESRRKTTFAHARIQSPTNLTPRQTQDRTAWPRARNQVASCSNQFGELGRFLKEDPPVWGTIPGCALAGRGTADCYEALSASWAWFVFRLARLAVNVFAKLRPF